MCVLQSRIVGFDLIRSCAILFVIAGHFSMNTSFSNSSFEGSSMFIQGVGKFFFGMGVPLFILMTGYLNSRKEATSSYYKGGVRVLGSYLLFSVITILFRKYYLEEAYSWMEWGHRILSFSAIPYGWYIEMWIGLFLLIPFLNILYHHIPTHRQKLLLLAVLYILTALPDLMNRYGMHLVPGFWASCFPLFFYFAGSYIREYQPSISKKLAWLIILAICLINPVFNVLFVKDHSMIHIAGGPWGIFGTIMAVLFFLNYYKWNTNTDWMRVGLESISKLSLDMYLCCYVFDALLYPVFKSRYYEDQSQFGIYFLVIVPLLFAGSYVTAWIKEKIFRF